MSPSKYLFFLLLPFVTGCGPGPDSGSMALHSPGEGLKKMASPEARKDPKSQQFVTTLKKRMVLNGLCLPLTPESRRGLERGLSTAKTYFETALYSWGFYWGVLRSKALGKALAAAPLSMAGVSWVGAVVPWSLAGAVHPSDNPSTWLGHLPKFQPIPFRDHVYSCVPRAFHSGYVALIVTTLAFYEVTEGLEPRAKDHPLLAGIKYLAWAQDEGKTASRSEHMERLTQTWERMGPLVQRALLQTTDFMELDENLEATIHAFAKADIQIDP